MARPSTVSKIKTSDDAFLSLGERLRESAARPNINKYKPHAKQLVFHKSPAKGRLFIGGNRSGKTVGGGVEMVMYLTGKHPYRKTPQTPIRGRIVTVDLIQGLEKIVKPEIQRWLPPSELINGSWEDSYEKSTRTLHLANGSECEFMTYEQETEKFAGTSRHAIWFDEEPPKHIFDECKARLIDTNGDWWITMTPVEGLTWTFEEIYSSDSPNIFVVEIEMDENPHLSQEAIDLFIEGLDKDDVKARQKGQYVPVGGFIYSKFFTEENIIDPVVPPTTWMHFASMDHGFTNPTAWLWMAVDKEGRVIVYHEHYESGQLVNYHAKKVLEINKELKRVPSYYVGDPSIRNTDPITGTSVHLEYLEHGVPIVLGVNDQKAGIQAVSRLMQGVEVEGKKYPKLYVTRDCANLIKELKQLRWDVWRDKKSQYEKNKKEEQKKKNDHAADALRYGVSSRPDLDTGAEMPPPPVYRDASQAIPNNSPYVDQEVLTPSSTEFVDSYLGDEW